MTTGKSELTLWIQESTGIKNFTFDIESTTPKGKGYMGEFFFVKVHCADTNEELHLAIKTGKDDPELRRKFPMLREAYKREVTFYKDVVPLFKQFQNAKSLQEPFEGLPECYKTFLSNNVEVMVLKNLKKDGYELHPKDLPLNIQHVRLGLKTYAKFHALSFAIQDQEPNRFDKVIEQYDPIIKKTFDGVKHVAETNSLKAVDKLENIGRTDLSIRLKEYIGNNHFQRLANLLDNIPNEKVIVHADSHNANYLFKYKDSKNFPSKMVLVDFQVSEWHSPMLDISQFLYLGVSKQELSEFDALMEFYYDEFAQFLTKLGSDPNKLFSRATMWDHWRRYSGYGFFIASSFLQMLFVNEDKIPTMKGEGEVFEEFLNVEITSEELYLERLTAILEHYFKL